MRSRVSPRPALLVLALALACDDDLAGPRALALSRGPYLQLGTPTSVVVRWRTTTPTGSVVRFGPEGDETSGLVSLGQPTTEHEVPLDRLTPGTRYHYTVGTEEAALADPRAAGTFVTAPAPGTARPTRVWVLGDAGTADANQRAVRDAFSAFTGAREPDLVLLLGDNAYATGTDLEYQRALFDVYPRFLRNVVFWPTIGNHDTAFSSDPPPDLPYFRMFTLPANGEAGGVPSGTERYYSFDHGDIHFVCLDSMSSDRSPQGAMLTWLRADLQANTRRFVIAYWHHPPYSKGSHDSDFETELIEMRRAAVPVLEAGGVDLVLTGHSHSYERSFLMAGHHGMSWTFSEAHKRAPGAGGAVYVVAGSSGKVSDGPLDHPAMLVSLDRLGSLVLDAEGARLDVRFLRETGAVDDHFVIVEP